MTTVEVKTRMGKKGDQETVKFNFGDNLEESIRLFGKDVVYNGFFRAAKIDLQSFKRAHMSPDVEGGPKKGAALQKLVDSWKPGMKRPGATKSEKARKLLNDLSAEERANILAEYQK